MKKTIKIISVGGSIIIPKTGFDIKFLKKFRELILSHVKKGIKFVLVVGGGATCRYYQENLSKVVKTKDIDLDWLGIYTTWYNAEFVRLLFGEFAYKEVVKNPTKKIKTNKAIIIAGGWEPGWSTDMDAVLLAKNFKANEVINLSNIDYVYDKDPKDFPDAKPLGEISWKDFKEIIGEKWSPGANKPFDPVASKLADELGLKVVIINGYKLENLENVLNNRPFIGTIIQ